MPHYRFVATTFSGKTEEGTLEAASLYDFYAVMNAEGLRVVRVVDVSGVLPGVKVPLPPLWRPLGFAALLGLVGAVVACAWLPLPQKDVMLLLPALAVLTLIAMVAFRAAVKAPAALMPALFLEGVRMAPLWLRCVLLVLLAVALGQFLKALIPVLLKGRSTAPMFLAIRGILGVGAAVPLVVLGAALATELEQRKRLSREP